MEEYLFDLLDRATARAKKEQTLSFQSASALWRLLDTIKRECPDSYGLACDIVYYY